MNCSADRLLKNDPSAALPSSLIIAAYIRVRLVLRDFRSLASGHF